jgi:acyl-CoA:6-aminopenicillanic acid acyl transferase
MKNRTHFSVITFLLIIEIFSIINPSIQGSMRTAPNQTFNNHNNIHSNSNFNLGSNNFQNKDYYIGDGDIHSFSGTPKIIGSALGKRFYSQILYKADTCWDLIKLKGYTRDEVLHIVYQREQTLKKVAPNQYAEMKSIAQTCSIPYDTMLVISLFDELYQSEKPADDNGCTSWVAVGTATEKGNSLLHKNRDYSLASQIVVQVNETGKYSYKALTTISAPSMVAAGINENGLSVINNMVTTTDVHVDGIGNLRMNRKILEECKTVDEVFTVIDETKLNSGVIFLVADKDKGAIIEVKASGRSSYNDSIIINNYSYRSNSFQVLNGSGSSGSTTSDIRYNAAKEFLDSKNGTISLSNCNELSRHLYVNNGSLLDYDSPDGSIANYHTLLGATFEIHNQYPATLSVMWTALGNPCYSIYTPIHVASTKIHESFQISKINDYVDQIGKNNIGPKHGYIPTLLRWEDEIYKSVDSVESQALIKLVANNPTEAINILTQSDSLQCANVENKLSNMSINEFWKDSFYYTNAIGTSINVSISNSSVYLSNGKNSGNIQSISIDQSGKWTNVKFYANISLPTSTGIKFYILNEKNDQILLEINSTSAISGIKLPTFDASEIILMAVLSSNDTSKSPILYEWYIIGDLKGDSDNSTFWFYAQIIGGIVIFDIGIFIIWRIKKKKKLKQQNTN